MTKKRALSMLMAAMLFLVSCTGSVQARDNSIITAWSAEGETTVTAVSDQTPEATYNTGSQTYGNSSSSYAASPVSSYLVDVGSRIMRVEYTGNEIVVEYYDGEWNLAEKKTVSMELPLFGGFYAGSDAYYVVYGQNNVDEDDATEVIRVVKYNTNWVRQGAASLYGANTVVPFDAGSLRMAECGGYLYIRTSHLIYTDKGVRHQTNLMIEIDDSSMEVTDSLYKGGYNSNGFVSHSFNQFLIIDDENNLVAVDHGDANPRSAILMRYMTKAGESQFGGNKDYNNNRVDLLEFEGESGTNYTGASLGGLEYSSSSYLTVGNSVIQDEDWDSHTGQNVFVAVTSRSDLSTSVKWITDYDTDGKITASTPQIVKIDSDAFLLLWTTKEYMNESAASSYLTKLHYVRLNGEGDEVGSICTVDGQLSDCQPIVSDGSVIWYVTGDANAYSTSYYNLSRVTTPYFYRIDSNGSFCHTAPLETPVITSAASVPGGIEVSWTKVSGAEEYEVYCNGSQKVSADNGDTTSAVISGTSGSVLYLWVEAFAGDEKSLVDSKLAFYYLATPTVSLTETVNGFKLQWSSISGAEGYQIYRKEEGGTYTLIRTTEDTSWEDTEVNAGTTYTYQVFSYNDTAVSGGSEERTKIYIGVPVVTEMINVKGGIQVTWATVEGVSQYTLYWRARGSYLEAEKTYKSNGDLTMSQKISAYIESGVTYDIYVTAVVDGKDAGKSGTVSILYLETPTVSLKTAEGTASLEWNEITGAEGYQIYRKESDSDYDRVAVCTDTSWTDKNLAGGKVYTYQVVAYAGETLSGGSAEQTAVYLTAPILQSVKNTNGKIEVTWKTTDGAESYCVYYKQSTQNDYTEATFTAEEAASQSAVLNVTEEGTYEIYVTARMTGIESEASNSMTLLVEIEPETEAETEPETKPETEAETEPGTEPETEPESKAETEPESKAETEPESKAETEPESKAETEPESKAETEPESKAEIEPETKPEAESETESETEKETKSEAGSKADPSETEPMETESQKKSEANSKTESEEKKAAQSTGGSAFLSAPAEGVTYQDDSDTFKVTVSSGSTKTVAITATCDKSATSVTIPTSVKIGSASYKVTAIGDGAFSGCKKLKSVTIGSNVTVIGSKAFYKCTALKSVSGCTAVTSVGSKAFYKDTALTTVKGMTKVTSIGSSAFYKCSKLTQAGKTKNTITMAKVKTIGSKAFYGCSKVKKVSLTSKNLTEIGASAFSGCSAMTSFTEKSTKLKTIGKKAFYGDKKLATVTFKTTKLTKSSVGTSAFKGVKSSCTYKVPSKKAAAYKKILKARGAGSKFKVKKA